VNRGSVGKIGMNNIYTCEGHGTVQVKLLACGQD